MNDQMQKVINHPATVPAGVGILAFGVGMGLGFLLGRRTKKTSSADLYVVPRVDLDLPVEEYPDREDTRSRDYVVKTEEAGVNVINNMHALIQDYGRVSVSDLCGLMGIKAQDVEKTWGWTDLEYSMVEQVRGGWAIVLPDPELLADTQDEAEVDVQEKIDAGHEFIRNRFALPDIEELEVLEDETEDEEGEEEEDASEEEVVAEAALEEGAGVLVENDGSRRANAFAQGGDNWDLLKEMRGRKDGVPYVIHRDEFYAEEKGYSQYSLTYFAGDNIMMAEDETIMYNHDRICGELKWGHGSGNPIIVYVRNDKYRAEYEITHLDGLYSEEIQGMDIPNNQRVKNLEHSDEPRRFRDRTE